MGRVLMAIGFGISAVTAWWWNGELAGRADRLGFVDGLSCLVKIGGSDCRVLWFVGLHQENQIAGVVFWIGLFMAAFGIGLLIVENDRRQRAPTE